MNGAPLNRHWWPSTRTGGGRKCSGTPAGNCARSNPNSPVKTFVAYATKVRHGREREQFEPPHVGCYGVKSFSTLSFHRRIHLDQRQPWAFEAFARQFLRRVNAEFAVAGDFAGGVLRRSLHAIESFRHASHRSGADEDRKRGEKGKCVDLGGWRRVREGTV